MRLNWRTALLAAAAFGLTMPEAKADQTITEAKAGATLDRVRAEGSFACGLVTEIPEYNKLDLHGGLDALGLEICKAIAVAALGDAAHMQSKSYPVENEALVGLQKGETDVLIGATPSATGVWAYGVQFGPPVFYDAQGIMVNRAAGIAKLADLAGRHVCFIDGTDTEVMLNVAMRARGIAYNPYPFQEEGEMDAALAVGHCDSMSADLSRLAEKRSTFHARTADFVMLPETLTLDPVAPAYRQGDAQWGAIIDWTIYALVQAEASGVTQANVAAQHDSADPVVQRLLGIDFAAGRALGLDHDWAARMIAAVGNYGEIYERTVGEGAPLRLPRGLNALWTSGGLMHPLPVR
jgi:general L-amino acid transport system substrate-binding protein